MDTHFVGVCTRRVCVWEAANKQQHRHGNPSQYFQRDCRALELESEGERISIRAPEQEPAAQALSQEAALCHDGLTHFFMVTTASHRHLVLANEYLLQSTCRVLGSCSKWLASRKDAALSNAVALVMGAVVSGQPPRVCPEACVALKRLCSEQVPADVLALQDVVNVRPAASHQVLSICRGEMQRKGQSANRKVAETRSNASSPSCHACVLMPFFHSGACPTSAFQLPGVHFSKLLRGAFWKRLSRCSCHCSSGSEGK
jgi:hypothetical protein